MVKGIRKFRSCKTLDEAQKVKAECEEKNALKNPTALSDLSELGKAAIRHALEKLKPFDATITEAVDFYVKFAKPTKGKLTIQEAMDLFRGDKRKQGLSESYVKNSRRSFFVPFKDAFKNCLMNDVTPTQAHRYVYGKDSWNKETKNSHIRHLRALYSFVISKHHATLNPFDSVPFVKVQGDKVAEKVLAVDDVKKLLQFALDTDRKAACASLALVLFCGIRVDEVERVSWENINLDSKKPKVDLKHGKNGRRRVNNIPENAVFWLRECRCSRGRVAPQNYTKAMQRLRHKAGVPYKQNAARHSFASYHIAQFEDGNKTAFMLGHPNAALLYSTYRELVANEDAKKYWDIVPASVDKAREEAAKQADAQAKAEAEEESNCGEAIELDGVWTPVTRQDDAPSEFDGAPFG
jgi:integrase